MQPVPINIVCEDEELHFSNITLLAAFFAASAFGHEFWLEPHDYTPPFTVPIIASVRVGEQFDGAAYPYVPSRLQSARLFDANGSKSIAGQAGQSPAIHVWSEADGLQILTWQSTPSTVGYRDFNDFVEFLKEEDLHWVVCRHRQRGLPDTGFSEAYSRYAKSLVQVGGGGRDRATGLAYEWVAQGNPYQPHDRLAAAVLPVLLLGQNKPLADTPVSIFRKTLSGEEVSSTVDRTDARGKVMIDISQRGEYLLSAVVMTEQDDHQQPWHSRWVSLTFGVE